MAKQRAVRLALRMVFALAIAMLSFFETADARLPDPSTSIEYRLPDGSYASLCEGRGDHGGKGDEVRHCNVCFAGFVLFSITPNVEFSSPVRLSASIGWLPPDDHFYIPPVRHRLGRGPPSFL